ncbi:unnamed protein product [Caenorhabditis angaria]|uniref:Protein amnionless n=1 Tax=Caenorhabditis angaria TaxID=860376 RepID=A0A9P1N9R2_9PELO|nr:unnamed protein product [Caenorhabditis angaria]
MTTQSMSRVIQCMEGQFQFLIPPNTWGKENDDGNIQRELAENPIVIQNDANLDNAPIEGLINENSRNETLSLICKHVGTCPKPQCLEPFKPFGHCCEICGFHYTDALLRTAKLLTDMGYAETHMVSLELVDKVATDFIYELVVVAKDSENYRDEIHSEIVNAMVRDLRYNMGTAYQLSIHSSNVYLSKTDRSIRISSIVFGFLVYAMIIVLCIGAYLYKTKPVELETGEEVVEKLANEEEPVVEDTSEDLSSEVEEVPGDEKLIEEVSTKLAAEIMQEGLNPNFAIELEEITEERLIE